MIPLDRIITGDTTITVQEGPYTTAVIASQWQEIPPLTKLYGELFFEGDRVHGYFTRIILHTGESLPVCIRLAAEYDRRGFRCDLEAGRERPSSPPCSMWRP
ncbi:hypothetical protein ACN28S_08770 [Cystobacter fuscus]